MVQDAGFPPCSLYVRHYNQTFHLGNKWHSAIRVVECQDDLGVVDHWWQRNALDGFIPHCRHCMPPPEELLGHGEY